MLCLKYELTNLPLWVAVQVFQKELRQVILKLRPLKLNATYTLGLMVEFCTLNSARKGSVAR